MYFIFYFFVPKKKLKMKFFSGNLHKLSAEDIIILFRCLDGSLLVARNFDKRSGLKMLIQGLYDLPVLPNLCKQIVLAWTIRSLSMYEMVRKCPLKKFVFLFFFALFDLFDNFFNLK